MKAQTNLNTKINNKKNLLKEEGNIRIEALYNIILTNKGKPDHVAIDIYIEARSWYKPKKTNIQGNIVYSSKLSGYGWQIGYEYLANKHKCTTELIRRKLVLLEKLGLLTRDFRTEYYHGKRFNNNMYLLVWKDTPHFYSEIGLEKKVVTTPQNQVELCKNSCTPLQQKLDNIYVIPNNGKKKEEEAKAYSSSFFSSTPIEVNTPLACAREGKIQPCKIVQISNTKPEPAPQEPIIEVPTLATGYMNEPAKVYQTNEIRSEATEVVTNSHGLETQPSTDCRQLESQALAAEKELYQSHKNRESSSGISLLQEIPFLTNLLAEPDTETTEIQEKVTPMKAQQIPLEPERNMEFELSGAIFKSFGNVRSNEIMDHCKFVMINPNKLGVQVSNGFSLSANDKETLKACIHQVYGNNINIVSSAVVKITQPETKFLQEPPKQPNCQRWEQFKKELLKYFPEKTSDHILAAWFDKLRVSEDAPNNRIILTGSTFYVDSVYSRFQSSIESVVKKNKITLELHYENNSQRPIIYKPNGWF